MCSVILLLPLFNNVCYEFCDICTTTVVPQNSALMMVLVRLMNNFRECKKYKYLNIIWVGSEKNNIELRKWVTVLLYWRLY